MVEYAALLALLTTLSILTFGTIFALPAGLSYIPLLLALGWIALRFGPFGTAIALILLYISSTGGVLFGTHAWQAEEFENQLFSAQVTNFLIITFFMILALTEASRKKTASDLSVHIRKLEDVLTRLRDEERAKDAFIATLAHELRNPLALMENSAELLKLELKDTMEGNRLIGAIMGRILAMARILDDLLDVSRIGRRKVELRLNTVDLRDIAHLAAKNIEPVIRARGHMIRTVFPDKPAYVYGDPTRLEQVMINLLVNAVKYTPDRGMIELRIEKSGGVVRLTVKDNGFGISKEMLPHIFKPYVQAHKPIRVLGAAPSLGVGLSITKQLVELHHGTIEASSEGEGFGSEFIMSLPVHFLEPAEVPKKAAEEKAPKSQKILVVDDEKAIADGIKILLEKVGGHTVAVAYSGEDAIRKASEINPEVTLLDIGLPDIDGYAVGRSIKEKGLKSRIVALSGYGQESDKQKAWDAGFDDYLVKPAGIAAIQRVLSRLTC